jgi:hypothetical protein
MARLKLVESDHPRVGRIMPIKSHYYLGKELMRRNSASNPLRAVSRCVEHLRLNSYQATHAEVFDASNGKLHAVVKRDIHGNVHILYERKLQATETL